MWPMLMSKDKRPLRVIFFKKNLLLRLYSQESFL